jgi:hypothetical protein
MSSAMFLRVISEAIPSELPTVPVKPVPVVPLKEAPLRYIATIKVWTIQAIICATWSRTILPKSSISVTISSLV